MKSLVGRRGEAPLVPPYGKLARPILSRANLRERE
jgi:hypothetical protein